MRIDLADGAATLAKQLGKSGFADAQGTATSAMWLQACGYPGLAQLRESLSDQSLPFQLLRDTLGLDLHNVSCARIAHLVVADVLDNGRAFLRNVRHGLFLVRPSVEHNFGIGCPVDPGFALGGERSKNPYVEKLDAAKRDGLEVDDDLWQSLMQGNIH